MKNNNFGDGITMITITPSTGEVEFSNKNKKVTKKMNEVLPSWTKR